VVNSSKGLSVGCLILYPEVGEQQECIGELGKELLR
jgi:hypothetical protein